MSSDTLANPVHKATELENVDSAKSSYLTETSSFWIKYGILRSLIQPIVSVLGAIYPSNKAFSFLSVFVMPFSTLASGFTVFLQPRKKSPAHLKLFGLPDKELEAFILGPLFTGGIKTLFSFFFLSFRVTKCLLEELSLEECEDTAKCTTGLSGYLFLWWGLGFRRSIQGLFTLVFMGVEEDPDKLVEVVGVLGALAAIGALTINLVMLNKKLKERPKQMTTIGQVEGDLGLIGGLREDFRNRSMRGISMEQLEKKMVLTASCS
ncbi:hypothetical protein TrLO_g10962 [Triparma laevis f. longispina]|uniref:Uncharacterized protein n=1 Tax=Triparma laevis f. longispina TaxID=1714387 RepID=A0A9W7AM30_9STRA|nr:hypothetical protein TrLO_g10962 [Triparma laevis f. longispina]